MTNKSLDEANYLSQAQYEQLLKPINAARVSRDGKGFSHLEAYDVRAHLNRLFGFLRWSADTQICELIFESEDEKIFKCFECKKREPGTCKGGQCGQPYKVWTVAYRAQVQLCIQGIDGYTHATYTEFAAGDASNQPGRADAHDLAIKTAESQALKRCAVNLGDQFGLSLYNDGSVKAVVIQTIVKPNSPNDDSPKEETRPEAIKTGAGEEVPLPGFGPGAEG